MKKEIKFLMILFVLLCNLSCSKSDSNPVNPNIVYKANLVGNNSIQTTNSTATGTATLTYNTTTKLFTLAVTYTGLTVTSSHIHKIGAGVIVAISPNVSPINFTSTTPLTTTEETELASSQYYFNLHSSAFPGGEISGIFIRQ
ncbi:CHRD domain-containing protein [Flavobacterium sp.]|uniref:CHRD domain-containing protein n=1 Tax=Flavobacterium sp. TaxID=239 RepID=UPI0037503E0A